MAFIRDEWCRFHGNTSHTNGKCSKCTQEAEAGAEAAWQALSIEEKVEQLRQALRHHIQIGQRRY